MAISLSELTRIWEKVLKKVQEKINEKKIFDTFFSETYIYSIEGNIINVVAPNLLAKTVLTNQYVDLVKGFVNDVMDDDSYTVRFYTEEELTEKPGKVRSSSEIKNNQQYFADAKINENLTFSTFIVGPFNKEAYKAALYVAKNDNSLFNPLFIYSHAGLGKTHLLHAIANEIKTNTNKDANILYITGEDLVEEYVKFVKAEKDQSLKDYFKTVDVLLLDDVQFLKNKVKTEEMLFYIYQDLIARGKRIIITSDTQPSELRGLEERLVSRFSQGLTIDIKEPDTESCAEIFKAKVSSYGLDVSKIDDSVIIFFAENFNKDIREIDGAVRRLIFYAQDFTNNDRITMDLAIEAIGSLKGGNAVATQLSEQKIINIVCDYFNITSSQIVSKTRTGQISLARQIAMYLIRKNLDVSLEKIGDMFGGKDHTTVMNGVSKVEKGLKTNEQLKATVDELEALIKQ